MEEDKFVVKLKKRTYFDVWIIPEIEMKINPETLVKMNHATQTHPM